MKGKPFLIGFIIGGAAAAMSTLLTMPSSGRENRMMLKEKTDHVTHMLSDIKDNLYEIKQTITKNSTEGQHAISEFVNDTKMAISRWKREISPHQAQLQKEIKDIEHSMMELESAIKNK